MLAINYTSPKRLLIHAVAKSLSCTNWLVDVDSTLYLEHGDSCCWWHVKLLLSYFVKWWAPVSLVAVAHWSHQGVYTQNFNLCVYNVHQTEKICCNVTLVAVLVSSLIGGLFCKSWGVLRSALNILSPQTIINWGKILQEALLAVKVYVTDYSWRHYYDCLNVRCYRLSGQHSLIASYCLELPVHRNG